MTVNAHSVGEVGLWSEASQKAGLTGIRHCGFQRFPDCWPGSLASLALGLLCPTGRLGSVSFSLAVYGAAKQTLSTLLLGDPGLVVKLWGCSCFPHRYTSQFPHQPLSEVHQRWSPRSFENCSSLSWKNGVPLSICVCFISNEGSEPLLLETPCGRRRGPLSAVWQLRAELPAASHLSPKPRLTPPQMLSIRKPWWSFLWTQSRLGPSLCFWPRKLKPHAWMGIKKWFSQRHKVS